MLSLIHTEFLAVKMTCSHFITNAARELHNTNIAVCNTVKPLAHQDWSSVKCWKDVR